MDNNITYEVYDKSGAIIKGSFSGSQSELNEFVRKKEYILISYKDEKKSLKQGKFTQKDFIYFIEELLYLIDSGMSIDKALLNMKKTVSKEVQANFYNSILDFLKAGNQFSISLSKAAKKQNIDVDNLTIVLIETNESVGNLTLGLKKVKEHLDFKNKIFSEIKQTLSYPIFLIIMSVLMVFFVFLFIVPKFSTIFTPEEFASLPAMSKFVLELGLAVESNIDMILIVLGIISTVVVVYRKKVLSILSDLFLKIPVFAQLNLKIQLSYFFTSLALMLEGGLDLKKALYQSKKVITHDSLNQLIENTLNELKKGISISQTFSKSTLIAPNTISLISAGENSGKIGEIFNSLSKRYLDEFQKTTKSFLSILEPLIIVMMGGIIAIVVISIMLAVISITDIAG